MWMCDHVVVSHSYLRLFDLLQIERFFAFKTKHQRTKLNSKEPSKTYLEHFSVVVLICHNFSFSFILLKSVFICFHVIICICSYWGSWNLSQIFFNCEIFFDCESKSTAYFMEHLFFRSVNLKNSWFCDFFVVWKCFIKLCPFMNLIYLFYFLFGKNFFHQKWFTFTKNVSCKQSSTFLKWQNDS